jgi:2-polyprenyl-3-methyl-5-hydroxy-6-metoxy-1,4-benzoquinol methylase
VSTPTARAIRALAYENPRPEVQALVPRSASTILDLGCSSGALGAALRARQPCAVTGVEADPGYAADAEARLDRVICADLETAQPAELGLEDLECLIAADVLEHLRDPWTVLERFTGAVRPGGTVVISLPNVRYWTTFTALGRHGVWPLAEEGIFDRTHLRWFTLADARRLMQRAGLHVTEVAPQYRLRPSDWRSERWARPLGRTPLGPFFVFQYVLAGVRTGS